MTTAMNKRMMSSVNHIERTFQSCCSSSSSLTLHDYGMQNLLLNHSECLCGSIAEKWDFSLKSKGKQTNKPWAQMTVS